MTKREAKRWVCGMAAHLIATDLETGEVVPMDDPNHNEKRAAFDELIAELKRRGGDQ